jgi:hypothetical protein
MSETALGARHQRTNRPHMPVIIMPHGAPLIHWVGGGGGGGTRPKIPNKI